MDPAIKNQRQAIAQNRLATAATALAARYGLQEHAEALDACNLVRATVRPLYQLEATADLLDAIIASEGTEAADATPASELAALDAITPGLADKLVAGGFTNLVMVREATDDELEATPGVGKATVRKIRAEVGYSEPEPDEPMDDADGMEAEPE